MKARGKYLLGIDFGKGGARPLVYVVPVDKRGIPNQLQAETLTFEALEKMMDEVMDTVDAAELSWFERGVRDGRNARPSSPPPNEESRGDYLRGYAQGKGGKK